MAESISILGFAVTEIATMACMVLAALLEICAAAVHNWQVYAPSGSGIKVTFGLFKFCRTVNINSGSVTEVCSSIDSAFKGASGLSDFYAVRAMVLLVPIFIVLTIALFIWFKKRAETDPYRLTITLISVAGTCAIVGVVLYVTRIKSYLYDFGPGFGLACASCAFLIIADSVYTVGKKIGWN